MILPFSDKWRIQSDQLNWKVQKLAGSQWKNLGYYSDVKGAINGLAERQIREMNTETLEDALVEIENLSRNISKAFGAVK